MAENPRTPWERASLWTGLPVSDPSPDVRGAAALAYGRMGTDPEPLVASYDPSADIFERVGLVEAVRALPELGRTAGLEQIAAIDPDPWLTNLLDAEAP